MNEVDLKADARNRALRTLVVNLGIDVGVAVVLVLMTAFSKANGWGDLEWSLLGFTLVKSALTSAGSYILRAVLDGSSVPTPLPPAPVPSPNDPPGPDGAN